MPCYQINTISLKWTVGNKDRLIQTLKEMKREAKDYGDIVVSYPFRFNLTENKVELVKGYRADLNVIKRKYSEITLREIAKKKRWAFKVREDNKFQMVRY